MGEVESMDEIVAGTWLRRSVESSVADSAGLIITL